MQDLQEVTQEVHYENFRAEKLKNGDLPAKKSRSVLKRLSKFYVLFLDTYLALMAESQKSLSWLLWHRRAMLSKALLNDRIVD